MTEERLRAVTFGELQPLSGPVTLVEHDPAWPALYERERRRIRAALGVWALLVEHVGSTSIPGLAAKPVIDILVAVEASADEASYLPALEASGYVLHVREPEWHEHRMLRGPDTPVNLHVFGTGSPEIERMLRFRDWLRTDAADRALYLAAKRELAPRTWEYVQGYADAKSTIVEEILVRAMADR
jgi:GrpB-like predicted nucleotidyltransferase (UPF0157 family)